LNPDNVDENYLMYSTKYFELRINGEIFIYDVDKLLVSCTVLESPATCNLSQMQNLDDNFKDKAAIIGLEDTDAR